MERDPETSPESGSLQLVRLDPQIYAFNLAEIGRAPHDKSSRLVGYYSHWIPWNPAFACADEDLATALHPNNIRLVLLRDLGDAIESVASLVGERVMEPGKREKALGIQVPFDVGVDGDSVWVQPLTTASIIPFAGGQFLSEDEATRGIAYMLSRSALAANDVGGGMVLEIPGFYDMATVNSIRAAVEFYSSYGPTTEVFSPVPLNAALQIAFWRTLASVYPNQEVVSAIRPAYVITDHPGINPNTNIAVKSRPGGKIELRETILPRDQSDIVREGVPVTAMAFRKRGSDIDYAAELAKVALHS